MTQHHCNGSLVTEDEGVTGDIFYIFINEMLDIEEKRDDYRLAQLSLRSSEVSHKFLSN